MHEGSGRSAGATESNESERDDRSPGIGDNLERTDATLADQSIAGETINLKKHWLLVFFTLRSINR